MDTAPNLSGITDFSSFLSDISSALQNSTGISVFCLNTDTSVIFYKRPVNHNQFSSEKTSQYGYTKLLNRKFEDIPDWVQAGG